KKAAYTEAIPYKTGIGRENPFNCKAINDARSVFFLPALYAISMALCIVRTRAPSSHFTSCILHSATSKQW
ncbi:hypothetical protein NXU25_RS25645, partial [Escherichia coli]